MLYIQNSRVFKNKGSDMNSLNPQPSRDYKDESLKIGTPFKYVSSFMGQNSNENPYTKLRMIYKDIKINDDTKTIMLSKQYTELYNSLSRLNSDSKEPDSPDEDPEPATILQLIQAKQEQEWTPTPLSQLSTIDETEACGSSNIDATSPNQSERFQSRENLEKIRSRRLMPATPKFDSKSTLNSGSVNKEDLDVKSILTFVSTLASQQTRVVSAVVQGPGLKTEPDLEQAPRWSLRRSHCAACSERWKDKSSIQKIRCSGLKKGSSSSGASSPTSVLAPARLRKAVKADYVYKTHWSSGSDIGSTGAFNGQRMLEKSVLERARRRHASKLN